MSNLAVAMVPSIAEKWVPLCEKIYREKAAPLLEGGFQHETFCRILSNVGAASGAAGSVPWGRGWSAPDTSTPTLRSALIALCAHWFVRAYCYFISYSASHSYVGPAFVNCPLYVPPPVIPVNLPVPPVNHHFPS